MRTPTLILTAILVLSGCRGAGDDDLVGFKPALYRIERGRYSEVELRPQWLWLRGDGEVHRSSWPGGHMSPEAKRAVDLHVLRARGAGHAITYISSGEPDPASPPRPTNQADPGSGSPETPR